MHIYKIWSDKLNLCVKLYISTFKNQLIKKIEIDKIRKTKFCCGLSTKQLNSM